MKLTTRSWGEEGCPLAVLVHGVSSSSRTWCRVGLWFAERGWHAVAVDLRRHGDSPRAAHGLTLSDLTEDLRETVLELLGSRERMNVMLGHSLGVLAALKLCGQHGDLAGRLVLEEPPGSENSDFGEVARMVESDVTRAREAPEEAKREQLEENPSWTEEDATNNVTSLRNCDAGPVAEIVRNGLRYDLSALIGSIKIPTLLVLGSEARGSALPEPERTTVKTHCGAAGQRRSIPATARTGKTSRATSGSWTTGSEDRAPERGFGAVLSGFRRTAEPRCIL